MAIIVKMRRKEGVELATENKLCRANIKVELDDDNQNALVPENIKSGAKILGVEGIYETPTEKRSVDLNLADGNQVVDASTGKVMTSVVIMRPPTLQPENIAESVKIAGVTGTYVEDLSAELTGQESLLSSIEAILGISSDTMAITTAEEFASMNPDGVYYLASDITISSSYGTFRGTLYGNNKTVTTTAPLFEKLDGASVYDLTITGEIDMPGTANVGALAKEATSVYAYNVINEASVTASNKAGGIVGFVTNASSFISCANGGDVTSGVYAGGVIGHVTGSSADVDITIKNCNSACAISGGDYSGGIVGRFDGSFDALSLENCTSTGFVTTMENGCGGIVGYIKGACIVTFESCVSGCAINSALYAGGIVATIAGDSKTTVINVNDCASTGSITANHHTGGIIGYVLKLTANYYFNVNGCVYVGKKIKNTNTAGYTGGILGDLEPSASTSEGSAVIDSCVAITDIESVSRVGGIAGELNYGSSTHFIVRNCLFSGSISVNTYAAHYVGGLIAYAYGGRYAYMEARNNAVYAEITHKDGTTASAMIGYCNHNTNVENTNNVFVGKISAPIGSVFAYSSGTASFANPTISGNYYYYESDDVTDYLHYRHGNSSVAALGIDLATATEEQLKRMTSATEDVSGFLGTAWTYAAHLEINGKTFTGNIPVATKDVIEANTIKEADYDQ